MIKVSRLVLAALFLLLFSGMSFGQEMGAGESGPGTGVIGGSSASMNVDPSIFGSSSSTGGTDWSKCSETISIGSADALKKFASRVNGGETSLCGKLTADIELNGGASNQWIPIGTKAKGFLGTFDGQGHTIKGLYVDNVDMDYVGLFGNVANGVVKNVGVMDSHIKGWAYVGGVVGNNVSGSVSNVYNTGFVNGEWDVGGVVGYNGGIVSNVYNTGAVSGTNGVGGVVGGNDGTVNNAYYNTDFYAGNAVGGGDASGENVEGKTTLELASKTLPDGFDENVWVAGSISIGDDGSVTFGLPYLNGQSSQLTFKLEMDVNKYLEISTALQLKLFAQLVNSGETSINGKLIADICLNACNKGESVLKANGTLSDNASNFTQWTPIGTDEHPYTGTFDGNGHIIRGLYFNDENTDYVGLFGYINESAKVQNVGVVDSYFKGEYYVGGVVGYNAGGTVSNVYNTGVVSGKFKVGGVVGENYEGTVSKVYNTGAVSGNENVGGVVGENYEGTVSKVYNTGSVSGYYDVGGVVGFNNKGTVSNAYNTGSVSGSGDDVGGVVGYNYGTVSNGFFNTTYYSGNAIGESEGTADNVKGLSMTDLANLTVGNGGDFPLLEGETESPWAKGIYYDKATGKLANSELPYLKSLPKPQDVEMEFNVKDNVIQISSTDDLKNFAKLVNEYHITDVDAELTTNLTVNSNLLGENNANVDAETGEYKGNAPANVWTPIGTSSAKYTGTFDGKGHTIRGLYFNDESTDYVGLFGHISGSTAKVQNVGVVDSYFKGCLYVGGVVAYNSHGTVSNVYNTGSVSGKTYVGGVVGYSYYSTVSNVYNTGSVSGTGNHVGGVVGYSYYSTVSNVYNTGSVSGKTYVGGVVGYISNNGTVSNGFFNKAYYSGNAIGGGSGTANTVVGKTSTELANLTVGNGGDFPLLEGETESPWAKGIYYDKATGKLANSELPYLKSLPKPQDVEMEFNVKDNVIQISSTDDLKNFAKLVNEYDIRDVDAELTTSITLNSNLLGENNANVDAETGEYKGSAPANVWTPIGTNDNEYTGKFDGKGYTVSGLYFNNESAECVGLFGAIGEYSKVQNVGVVDSYFKGRGVVGGVVGFNNKGTVSNVYNKGVVSGGYLVGGVTGNSYGGTVSNSYNTGAVSGNGEGAGGVVGRMEGGSISNVYNTGSVSGDCFVGGVVGSNNNNGTVSNSSNTGAVSGNDYVGGVVGCNYYSTVGNVYNTGTVSGTIRYIGGVVGKNDHGTVSNVYNAGTVSGSGNDVGGVVGFNGGTIGKVYNTGTVSGTDSYIGGVVGNNWGSVSNVYNTGTVSGKTYVGGVVGRSYNSTVSNVYNTGSVSGSGNYVGGVVGSSSGTTVSNGFFNTEVTCENCSVVEGTTGKSSGEFADGTVAMLLHGWCEMDGKTCKEGGLNGSIWGQDVGQASDNDAAPTLSGVLKLGPLTIAKNAAGKDSTAIDGASELEMKIPAEFNVPRVTFKRSFAGNGFSTIMLPFKPNFTADDDTIVGVNFCEFAKYANNKIETTPVSQKDLKPNTPYLVSAAGATELVFKNGGTFNTTSGDAYNSETGEYKVELGGDGAGWSIYGTYEYKSWEEGDAGLGRTYGFAANDGVNDPAIVGKFAKVGAGAYIYPMRAYLEYDAPTKLGRPAANDAAANTVASLPDEIDVVIVDKDEKTGEQTTKVIGTINTRTGEIKFATDRWFDLQGRYLGNKKPTQKGAYYNNGKKVIVK